MAIGNTHRNLVKIRPLVPEMRSRTDRQAGMLTMHDILPRPHRGRSNTKRSAIAEGPRDASFQLKYCQLPRNMFRRSICRGEIF